MNNFHKCRRGTPIISCTPPSACPPSACQINTATFANRTPITIPASGAATPYPSSIAVVGLAGRIIKVVVRLINISHPSPADIDILLVGPGGQNTTIMSDVGDVINVTNVTLTLDDNAPSPLPESTPLVSGTFKPTNRGLVVDPFPPPAPVPFGGAALSVFNFTNPNGIWNLFVVDDSAFLGGGSIGGGWELIITTSNCTP